jgi:hypothetical protein
MDGGCNLMGFISAWSSATGSGAVSAEWADRPEIKKERERIESENAERLRQAEIAAYLEERIGVHRQREAALALAKGLGSSKSVSARLSAESARANVKRLDAVLKKINAELLARGHE